MPLLALAPLAVAGIVLGALALAWAVLVFNRIVRLRNRVREAFSGVDAQLKRRHDLIPNLVQVVSAYAAHERETLQAVTEARTAATRDTGLDARERDENQLTLSLGRLLALVERYPDLKADAQFRRLGQELATIEDDLQYARRYYNGTVRDHNVQTEVFPANVLAALLGLRALPFFSLDRASDRDLPEVRLGPATEDDAP